MNPGGACQSRASGGQAAPPSLAAHPWHSSAARSRVPGPAHCSKVGCGKVTRPTGEGHVHAAAAHLAVPTLSWPGTPRGVLRARAISCEAGQGSAGSVTPTGIGRRARCLSMQLTSSEAESASAAVRSLS